MTTSTVIAALKPLPQQGLFAPAVRLCLAETTEVHVDQVVEFDTSGFPMRVMYATRRGQRLLADVVELNGGSQFLPADDFVALPSCVPAYSLLTLQTPYRRVPARPSVADLHAWLVARITDFLETNGIEWVWTSTGRGTEYCAWKNDISPSAPLGDAFAWQASLEGAV